MAQDWTPVYDRTALDGYYVAMGTSGNQFKNAPVVGHLMADQIDAVEAGRDHDRDPVRVRLPRTGQVVDLSLLEAMHSVVGADAGEATTGECIDGSCAV